MIPLTDEERNAVYDSIEHWQRDILEPLKHEARGATDIGDALFIYPMLDGDFEYVHIRNRDNDCPLCMLYSTYRCRKCPYYKFYLKSCDGDGFCSTSVWVQFNTHPTRLNAEAMIAELRAIVDWQPDPRKKG